MTLPAVSLCGHTPDKTLNLVKLYLVNKPQLEHRVCLTFNGKPHANIDRAGRLLGVDPLIVLNDGSWDIGMHVKAMEAQHVFSKVPWVFCLNDDVQGMRLGWFEMAASLIEDLDKQIVGVQPNFMGIFPLEHIARVRNKPLAAVQEFARTHKQIRFLRTYAFAIKTTALYGLWVVSGMNSRVFERATLENNLGYAFLEDPETVYDSDYLRFRDGESYEFPPHC